MSKKIIAAAVISVIVLVAWFKWQPKTVEAIQVTQADISQTIVATGRVAPMAKVELASLVTAQIGQIHVREGEQISQDQLLISLTDASVDANLVQAQANLREAEQRVQELAQLTRPLAENNLAQAKANLTLAEAEYQRYASLQQKNLASQSSLDNARKTLDFNQQAYQAALKQWQATQHNGISTQLLHSRLAQAQAAFAVAQAKQAQLNIRAPSSGVLLQRLVEVGATAQAGKPLLTMASDGEIRIEAPIDEKSMRFLAPEQRARVIADAYPQQPFEAKLALIYPSIDPNRATINIRLVVEHPPAFLRPDMTVSIEMITGNATNTLVVPSDAVHDIASQSPWVMKVEQGQTVKQPVRLGIKGIGNSQILEGVTAGDWLVTQADIPLGTRVQVKARSPSSER
ncbi:MAG: efflux RND transporter periplasmic adaptor subunit [Gammaproteobacteria bacterium]|nr:efflux RND transporter periplasmic adaptor subunit [Gammaproteobacteria bacterium]